jgi:hypothetical protein
LESTTGAIAKASSVSPLAERSPEIAQDDSAIPVAIAPIPCKKSRRFQCWFSFIVNSTGSLSAVNSSFLIQEIILRTSRKSEGNSSFIVVSTAS